MRAYILHSGNESWRFSRDLYAVEPTHNSLVLKSEEGDGQVLSGVNDWWSAGSYSLANIPCQSVLDTLPTRPKWVGYYWPAVRFNDWFLKCGEPVSCPHCAMETVRAFLGGRTQFRGQPGGGGGVIPALIWCGKAEPQMHAMSSVLNQDRGETDLDTNFTQTFGEAEIGNGCSLCGFPGHNARTCSRMLKADSPNHPTPNSHYAKVGIEIEGRWNDISSAVALANSQGINHCEDGSIAMSLFDGYNGAKQMEFQTKPTALTGALRQLSDLYPDETDPSCGLHVHVSFKCPSHVTQLTSAEFFTYFKTRWVAWAVANQLNPTGPFMSRLLGKNEFCLPNMVEDTPRGCAVELDPFSSGARYKQLNFQAWNEHRTVECRLLPMFRDKSLAISAVTELVSIYEDWLCAEALELPKAEIGGDVPYTQFHETQELEMHGGVSETHTNDIPIIDLPPVAPGHVRVFGDQGVLSAYNRAVRSA